MTILIWNVRGLNKLAKMLMNMFFKISPSFIGLVETKVKLHNSQRITSCIPLVGHHVTTVIAQILVEFGFSGTKVSGLVHC